MCIFSADCCKPRKKDLSAIDLAKLPGKTPELLPYSPSPVGVPSPSLCYKDNGTDGKAPRADDSESSVNGGEAPLLESVPEIVKSTHAPVKEEPLWTDTLGTDGCKHAEACAAGGEPATIEPTVFGKSPAGVSLEDVSGKWSGMEDDLLTMNIDINEAAEALLDAFGEDGELLAMGGVDESFK